MKRKDDPFSVLPVVTNRHPSFAMFVIAYYDKKARAHVNIFSNGECYIKVKSQPDNVF